MTTTTFPDLGVEDWLVRQLGALHMTTPTAIQTSGIPHILHQRRCGVFVSETGSGKTACFALPILQELGRELYGVFALVVTASRELAYQITDQFIALGSPIGVRVAIVIGGTPHDKQVETVAKARPHIVVATPGRLAMLMSSFAPEVLPAFRNLEFLVLDEADRLLDQDEMRDETTKIVTAVRDARSKKKKVESGREAVQMLMFTATASRRMAFPGDIWRASGNADDHQKQPLPVVICVSQNHNQEENVQHGHEKEEEEEEDEDETHTLSNRTRKDDDDDDDDDDDYYNQNQNQNQKQQAKPQKIQAAVAREVGMDTILEPAASSAPSIPSTITQSVVAVPHVVKLPFLVVALRRHKGKSIIVFTNSCVRCELVRMTLQLLGFPVCSLNSLLSQKQRLESLAMFKTGISSILIATDVASRGLDIPAAGLVVHYDFPKLTATYVHRTGRTGRAGARGESLAVCTETETFFLKRLQQRIGRIERAPRMMTIDEHEQLLKILDDVSMAKVTGKTHLLDEFGDRIRRSKEASADVDYRERRFVRIHADNSDTAVAQEERQNHEQQQRQQQQERQKQKQKAPRENRYSRRHNGEQRPPRRRQRDDNQQEQQQEQFAEE